MDRAAVSAAIRSDRTALAIGFSPSWPIWYYGLGRLCLWTRPLAPVVAWPWAACRLSSSCSSKCRREFGSDFWRAFRSSRRIARRISGRHAGGADAVRRRGDRKLRRPQCGFGVACARQAHALGGASPRNSQIDDVPLRYNWWTMPWWCFLTKFARWTAKWSKGTA